LGFNELSDGFPTLIDTLYNQGIIEKRTFSFYLGDYKNNEKSELLIGGHDPYYQQEKLTYSNVIDEYYWAVKIDELYFNNIEIGIYDDGWNQESPLKGIIDSGTSLIYFDEEILSNMITTLNINFN
jgi:hypothetical protein